MVVDQDQLRVFHGFLKKMNMGELKEHLQILTV